MVLVRVGRQALVDLIGNHYIAGKLDVVIRELANLYVVNAENLLLLAGAEFEDGKKSAQAVKSGEDEAGADKGVEAASEGVGELVPHLLPVVVEPAAGDDGVSIEMRYVVTRPIS